MARQAISAPLKVPGCAGHVARARMSLLSMAVPAILPSSARVALEPPSRGRSSLPLSYPVPAVVVRIHHGAASGLCPPQGLWACVARCTSEARSLNSRSFQNYLRTPFEPPTINPHPPTARLNSRTPLNPTRQRGRADLGASPAVAVEHGLSLTHRLRLNHEHHLLQGDEGASHAVGRTEGGQPMCG